MESSELNKCDGVVFKNNGNEFIPISINGNFSFACGSERLKLFESDIPTEMSVNIDLRETAGATSDSCDLKIKVEIEDGKDLEFFIPSPSISSTRTEQNSISFYSKSVKKITIQCIGGGTSGCSGVYFIVIPLRVRGRKNLCPISFIHSSGGQNFDLACGTDLKIFESDERAELAFRVGVRSNSEEISCELKVIVEIEEGDNLIFSIPSSFQNEPNSITFYSRKIRSVKLICEGNGGVACRGFYNHFIVLRGEEEDYC